MSGRPERVDTRVQFGRLAYGAVVAGLSAGVLLDFARLTRASVLVFAATCGLLLALPVINMLFVIADEVRRRDRVFATLALGVLLVLAYTLARRLFGIW